MILTWDNRRTRSKTRPTDFVHSKSHVDWPTNDSIMIRARVIVYDPF